MSVVANARRFGADLGWVFRHELRLSRRDTTIFAVLFVMPFLVLYLVAPAMRPALILQGHAAATGAEQAMPGMAVLFSNFAMAFLAFAIFREHTWMTWDRLMIAPLSRVAVLSGKALLPFVLVVIQQMSLLFAAWLVFGVSAGTGLLAYILLTCALAMFTICAGLALTAWLGSLQQINSVVNIGTFALAGIGGAFGPIELMPTWMQTISVLSPNYWAISGFKAILIDHAGVAAILPGAVILVGFAAICFVIALAGFAGDRQKRAWA